jgi:hypothetical protein
LVDEFQNGATMKKYVSIAPLCFMMMFGVAAAQAPSKAAEKTAHVYGTGSMLKPKADSHEMARRKSTRHSRRIASSGKLKGEEFKSEAAAKAHCPTQPVVWVNTHGHVFHMSKSKYFGKTKYGAFACEKAAETAGFKAARS